MLAAAPQRPARPERCRRSHGSRPRIIHAIAFVSVCCAIGPPHAFGDLDGCEFPVTSDTGNDQSQTKEETEAELLRELAIKLRQFDRCLDRQRKPQPHRPATPHPGRPPAGVRALPAAATAGRIRMMVSSERDRVAVRPSKPAAPLPQRAMRPALIVTAKADACQPVLQPRTRLQPPRERPQRRVPGGRAEAPGSPITLWRTMSPASCGRRRNGKPTRPVGRRCGRNTRTT